ncbi:DNA methyltransferase [Microbacterium lushaniae]|uniref:Methylase n=1 Tax=Microbacterium lushaniae TaxID=2614639 RepID=A0A5J6L537_9MICO|nr:DNA methyltransferase [Microbacterium lushaniae]QEW03759.1 methylase [Microbacterium lushaniae]
MLDLVSEDLETSAEFLDKTFLEPAAGDGNFLVAILQRKLRAVELRYPRDDWAETSLFALASIYGIELLEDNHHAAKTAMLDKFQGFHLEHGISCSEDTDLYRAAAFLIDVNIVRGDTLTGMDWQGDEIQFSWWDRVPGAQGVVQRKPFTLASMRSQGFDFTIYASYAACRIEKVYEGNTAGA